MYNNFTIHDLFKNDKIINIWACLRKAKLIIIKHLIIVPALVLWITNCLVIFWIIPWLLCYFSAVIDSVKIFNSPVCLKMLKWPILKPIWWKKHLIMMPAFGCMNHLLSCNILNNTMSTMVLFCCDWLGGDFWFHCLFKNVKMTNIEAYLMKKTFNNNASIWLYESPIVL